MHLIGVLDHAEQAFFLALTVDVPTGVEDLVAAVLGVGLGEHHQFDVVGVAPQSFETGDQVIDFVLGKRQAQGDVGGLECGATATQYIDGRERLGLGVAEQAGGLFKLAQHDLRHAVVQRVGDQLRLGSIEVTCHIERNTALQARDIAQAAVVGDIAGLARPGRNGAKARHDQKQTPGGLLNRHTRTVLEQPGKDMLLLVGQLASDFSEVGKLSIQASNSGDFLAQLLE